MNETPQPVTRRKLDDATPFRFACNKSVPCFTRCCRDADMFLYPYDIIRMKKQLGMTSEAFLVRHTVTAFRDNPYFPSVMLKMSDAKGHPCSFLSESGCTVYESRPYSCRAYPLERPCPVMPKACFPYPVSWCTTTTARGTEPVRNGQPRP